MAVESFTFAGSSNLAGGSYDDEAQRLELEFRNGATYAYSNVPQGVVEGLRSAGSAGAYWNRYKNRFAYTRIG